VRKPSRKPTRKHASRGAIHWYTGGGDVSGRPTSNGASAAVRIVCVRVRDRP
jgi:hypothetical protein